MQEVEQPYDPKKMLCWMGKPIVGFSSDELIKIKYKESEFRIYTLEAIAERERLLHLTQPVALELTFNADIPEEERTLITRNVLDNWDSKPAIILPSKYVLEHIGNSKMEIVYAQ